MESNITYISAYLWKIVLNLDHAFERQWNDAQRGTLPSTALDFVGNLLFGEGKRRV